MDNKCIAHTLLDPSQSSAHMTESKKSVMEDVLVSGGGRGSRKGIIYLGKSQEWIQICKETWSCPLTEDAAWSGELSTSPLRPSPTPEIFPFFNSFL